ncbi:hypothetical protein DPMN_116895 [Dreissena polymorpha]|uniref:Uncharacterized protein n=1 Tax=Dreissena polymorpha TaxID=45954 RepID=A0A9D4KNU9_DREPO|nr:hypothetical protein DPMN_116895 [Dreissena polymorpha]
MINVSIKFHVNHDDEEKKNSCVIHHKTNVLTKFHENWAKNVTSRVRKMPRMWHVFPSISTIFELVRDINKTNWFTRKTAPPTGAISNMNVASRVFTNQMRTTDGPGRTDGRRTKNRSQMLT